MKKTRHHHKLQAEDQPYSVGTAGSWGGDPLECWRLVVFTDRRGIRDGGIRISLNGRKGGMNHGTGATVVQEAPPASVSLAA